MTDGSQIIRLFDKASESLKWPHFTFHLDDGCKIKFKRLSNKTRYPGSIIITNGKSFGHPDQRILGYIHLNGSVILNEMPDQLEIQIWLIITDPVEKIAINGMRYNHCCFCGIELTDRRSVEHGYGPICAEKWGLPWDNVALTVEDENALLKSIRQKD